MNQGRIFYSILISLSFSTLISGQIPFFKSHSFPGNYNKIQVNKVLETHNGFLLFGTSEGLFEYDGHEFIPFSSKDSILNIHVTALYEDSANTTWIGTKSGEIYFLLQDRKLKKWTPEEGTPSVMITGFSQTRDSTFWISTYGEGLYYYQKGRMYNMDLEDGLIDLEIYCITKHRENHILVATDSGVNVCKVKNGKKQIVHLDTSNGLSDEIVKTILPGKDESFWVGTYDKGIDYWDNKTQNFEPLIPDWSFGEINQMELFQDKEIWIGTNGYGLYRFDLKTKELNEVDIPRFQNSKIFDLHKDVEDNIWVLNNTSGISSANRQFEQIDHQLGNIQAVLTDKRNKLWLGTAEGLFLVKNNGEIPFEFQAYFQDAKINVTRLYEDHYGYLWVGTFGQGLYCIDVSTNKIRHFFLNEGLENGNILSIAGSNDRIWLATLGGVFEVELGKNIFLKSNITFKNYNHEDGLGTDFIYKVFIDSKNRVWFGTDGKGISVLEDEKITNFPEGNGIPLKTVYAITEDHRGHIWFSTAENGIFEFNGQTFKQLNLKEGIRNLEITGMVTDDLGNIIIIHPSGIDILNPETKHLIYYDEEVGLKGMEPVLDAVCKDQNGNIYFGAKNRIVKYSALSGYIEIHPRNQIRNVNVFFDAVDFKNVNSFDHTQNSLVFDYIGLWYTAPDKVEYRYQLEGYNPGWIYSKDHQAHYSNLKPGKYTFKVSSTENGAFDQEPVTSYSFTINAPFWQEIWFVIACVLLMGGLIYAWVKWNAQRIQRGADIQRERVESQLEVLKSQINPHFLFNSFNTLISLIEEEPASATVYVEKLSDFYRSLLQYREQDLIPLQEELDLLQNFTYLLKKRFGKNINLQIPDINGKPAFIPPLTLQMLVENAIKHNVVSKRKPLYINIFLEGDKICIINNLQKKMTKEKSTRFGLQSIQTRYALRGKSVEIEETENEFKVTIPIISNS
jgi:ligand-binding sensor domain-containing protein